MKFKKLQLLLKHTPKEQLSGFETSAFSSYKDLKRQQVKDLYHVVISDHPSFDTGSILIALNLSEKRLDDIANKLLFALEAYLANSAAKRILSEVEKDMVLMDYYSERQLWKNHDFIKKRLLKALEKDSALYPADFMMLYQYYKEIGIANKYKEGRKKGGELQDIIENLDRYYLYEKLKYSIEDLHRQKTLKAILCVSEEERNSLFAQAKKFKSIPTIALLCSILQIVSDRYRSLENEYPVLKAHFTKAMGINCRNEEEVTTLVTFMIDICIQGINHGIKYFGDEYLSLIEFLEKEGYILEKGEIPVARFKNIITNTIRVKRFDWGEKFIERNVRFLKPMYKEVVDSYHKALLALEKGDPAKAAKLLPPKIYVNWKDDYLALSLAKLRVMVLFENKDFDLLYSAIDLLESTLTSSEIDSSHILKYRIFIQCSRKLLEGKYVFELPEDMAQSDKAWFVKMFEYLVFAGQRKTRVKNKTGGT